MKWSEVEEVQFQPKGTTRSRVTKGSNPAIGIFMKHLFTAETVFFAKIKKQRVWECAIPMKTWSGFYRDLGAVPFPLVSHRRLKMRIIFSFSNLIGGGILFLPKVVELVDFKSPTNLKIWR